MGQIRTEYVYIFLFNVQLICIANQFENKIITQKRQHVDIILVYGLQS